LLFPRSLCEEGWVKADCGNGYLNSLLTEGLMKSLKITMLMAALLVLAFVLFQKNIKIETPATVYSGGDILTMVGDQPQYVEALAVRDGRIVAVGSKSDVVKAAGGRLQQIDLAGKTLLPGFIDAHSHILNYADSLAQGNLAPQPIGKITRIADLVAEMQRLQRETKAAPGEWLIGQGYDQDFLVEKRHPTADDLDAAFPENPVVLLHASGHMLVANSLALKAAGVGAETKDPVGGTFIRKPGGSEPAGLVQEMAMYSFQSFIKAPRKPEVDIDLLKRAIDHYTANGYTTAAEHLLMPEKMPLIESAADQGVFKIDLVAAPAFTIAKEIIGTGKLKWGEYRNGLKYVGIKVAVDGSPQGKTAFLTKPYRTPVPGCSNDCHGFSNITQDDLNALFILAYRHKVQLFSHCNGDAAIDMMIKAHQFAEQQLGEVNPDRRTVIIHSQIMRPDQLDSYKKFGLLPSFFSNHVFYWGDVHLANLGAERAGFISPLASAFARGIKASNHTDATVTPTDPMFLLWTSVNRLTRSNKVLGENERITPYQGLVAMTANAAWEYFEEKTKGTLEVGKIADLVILTENPLKVDAGAIKDIKVLETVKAGKTVFTAP
jgi:hypothetical protein